MTKKKVRKIPFPKHIGENKKVLIEVPVDDIKELVKYLYPAEEKHYEECELEERAHHIFNHVVAVNMWIDKIEKGVK